MRANKKPCPGCGEVDPFQEKERVCRNCIRLLNLARSLEETQKKEKDLIGVVFGRESHWNEYILTRGEFESSDIMQAFQRLAESAAIPASDGVRDYKKALVLLGDGGYGSGKSFFLMKRATAEAIRELRAMIQPLIDSAYEKGKRDGHNLLMRLASGDLGPNEYLRKTEEED